MEKDNPIAALRARQSQPEEDPKAAQEQEKAAPRTTPRTANQHKAQVLSDVESLFKRNKLMPVLGFGGIVALSIGALVLVSGSVNSARDAKAIAASQDNIDWKTKALNAEERAAESKAETQRILRASIQSDPSLKFVRGQIILPKAPPVSKLQKPIRYASASVITKAPPLPPRIVYRYRSAPPLPSRLIAPAPRPIAPSRLLATTARIDRGIVENPDYKPTQVAQALSSEAPKEATVQANTNGIAANRAIPAKFRSALRYSGNEFSKTIAVEVETTADISSDGRLVLPRGSILTGFLSKSSRAGYVEINFVKGRFREDAGKSFDFQAVATDTDGGILVVQAPKRTDGTIADVATIGLSALKGFTTATNQTQTSFNGFNGSSTFSQNNNDPTREAIRAMSEQATTTLSKNTEQARADSRAGNLDFSLPVGSALQVRPVNDLVLPPIN
jgi:hypothetical protein